jgi:hypothetical protein
MDGKGESGGSKSSMRRNMQFGGESMEFMVVNGVHGV